MPKRVLRKVPVSESVGSKLGVRKSAEKVLRAPSPAQFSTEARTPKHFFGTFLRLRLEPALSKALFSALFLVGALAHL